MLSEWIKTTLHLLDSRLLTTRWLVFLDFVSAASQPCLALISSQGTHLNAPQRISTHLNASRPTQRLKRFVSPSLHTSVFPYPVCKNDIFTRALLCVLHWMNEVRKVIGKTFGQGQCLHIPMLPCIFMYLSLYFPKNNLLNFFDLASQSKMVRNGPKWSRMVQTVQNGPKWSRMVQTVQLVDNGPKRSKTVQTVQ